MSLVLKIIVYIIASFSLLLQVKATSSTRFSNHLSHKSNIEAKFSIFDESRLPFALAQQVNGSRKHASYQYSFSQPQLTFHPALQDSRISYALCEYDNYTEKNCKIVLRDMNKNNNEETYCNITLKAGKIRKIFPKIKTYPFGKDRVIIIYWEYFDQEIDENMIFKFNTLRLNDCKISGTEINVKTKVEAFRIHRLIINKEDSYTISSPFLCYTQKNCRINFNNESKVITPTYSDLNLVNAFITPFQPHPQSNSYLILNISDFYEPTNGTLYFLNNKGLKVWKSFEYNFESWDEYEPVIRFSSDPNNFIICSSSKANINCTSFDSEGNIKLDTTIDLSWKPPETEGYPIPLPNNGFLLLVHENYFGNFGKLEIETCVYRRLYVKKIGIDGKESFLPLVTYGKLDSKRQVTVRIFENNAGEYCVSQMSTDYYYDVWTSKTYLLKSRIDCFTEEDVKYNENELIYQCNV